jgi:hypothetical protein
MEDSVDGISTGGAVENDYHADLYLFPTPMEMHECKRESESERCPSATSMSVSVSDADEERLDENGDPPRAGWQAPFHRPEYQTIIFDMHADLEHSNCETSDAGESDPNYDTRLQSYAEAAI